jgi:hypothetical protein
MTNTYALPSQAFQATDLPSSSGGFTSRFTTPARLQGFINKLQHKLPGTLYGALKFNWNKVQQGAATCNIGPTPALINKVEGLHYFTGFDENGIARGGNLPWLYVNNLYQDKCFDEADKYRKIRGVLAQLPGNVSFRFIMSPDITDLGSIKNAFTDSGFMHYVQKTFIYTPLQDGRDLLAQLKSDARNKINSARRDLEIVEMSAEDYFAFYKENLAAAGKDSWFNLNIDHQLVEEGLKENLQQAHIIATRRKAVEGSPGPFPIEAAIVLTGGADGFMKLLRITYKREDKDNPSFELHKHAVKFLIFESMSRAALGGFRLDTDCFTPGAESLYTRFGVFELVSRHEFQRKSMQLLQRKTASLGAKVLKRLRAYALSRLSYLIYQLLLTHHVFQTIQSVSL